MKMVCALSSLCGGVAQKGLGLRNHLGGEIICRKTRRRPQRSHACCMYSPSTVSDTPIIDTSTVSDTDSSSTLGISDTVEALC